MPQKSREMVVNNTSELQRDDTANKVLQVHGHANVPVNVPVNGRVVELQHFNEVDFSIDYKLLLFEHYSEWMYFSSQVLVPAAVKQECLTRCLAKCATGWIAKGGMFTFQTKLLPACPWLFASINRHMHLIPQWKTDIVTHLAANTHLMRRKNASTIPSSNGGHVRASGSSASSSAANVNGVSYPANLMDAKSTSTMGTVNDMNMAERARSKEMPKPSSTSTHRYPENSAVNYLYMTKKDRNKTARINSSGNKDGPSEEIKSKPKEAPKPSDSSSTKSRALGQAIGRALASTFIDDGDGNDLTTSSISISTAAATATTKRKRETIKDPKVHVHVHVHAPSGPPASREFKEKVERTLEYMKSPMFAKNQQEAKDRDARVRKLLEEITTAEIMNVNVVSGSDSVLIQGDDKSRNERDKPFFI